jgi:hypothetical protein
MQRLFDQGSQRRFNEKEKKMRKEVNKVVPGTANVKV